MPGLLIVSIYLRFSQRFNSVNSFKSLKLVFNSLTPLSVIKHVSSLQGVHKQFGISLVTPAFPQPLAPGVTRHRVRLELVRPSDEACSEPVDFYFTAASAPRSAASVAADKENTGLLVNISDNHEDYPNIKIELAPMMPKDYQDLLCNNPMDLRDSRNIGDSLTAFEHVMNNLSGKNLSDHFRSQDPKIKKRFPLN